MSVNEKFQSGAAFPPLGWEKVGGGRIMPARESGWRLLIVYRGKHCPICRRYLGKIDAMQDKFVELGVTLWAVSADPIDRAAEEADMEGWTLPVLAGLSEDDMRTLGLYISSPRSPDETDRNFSEPAMFLIGPAGDVRAVDISSAPYLRPELETLIGGIRFVQEKDDPARGVAS
ncbi:redoxin domain-containing protein [Sphingomonas sp. PAMC 26621]|uniref:redoxin domain-containing protein n=1 Tax=Sphingomonas sp. PAMC 26621 TaxID=1112213 RepID=UPI000319B6EE|nr:redoxin domain-containing protein [Sphingomonas sp. PAMC 26621]